MEVTHLGSTALVEEVVASLATTGVVVVDDLVPTTLLDRIEAELSTWVDATPGGSDDFAGWNTHRTGGLIARSPSSHELILHPLVQETVGSVLAHATSYQLHLTQRIAIGPDSPLQPLHRDQWAFDFFPFPNTYEVQCNTIWAVTDFVDENGATRVVPGSITAPDGAPFTHADTVPAEMTRGSVLFYTGKMYHGGGANLTDQPRVGLNITYAVSWLRQEENQYLTVPLEQARELSPDLLRLMGYARGAYALGYVDDLRDPMSVVTQVDAGIGFGD